MSTGTPKISGKAKKATPKKPKKTIRKGSGLGLVLVFTAILLPAIAGLGAIFILSAPEQPASGGGQAGRYPMQVGDPGPGEEAPPMELGSTGGGTFDLSQKRGETVLLYFQEGLALTWRRAGSLRAALAGGVGAGFAVAALGPALQIAAAPLDGMWHAAYGLDVTIWSPPHLMGIAGGMVAIYGLLGALGAGLDGGNAGGNAATREDGGAEIWRGMTAGEALGVGLFGAALALSLFSLGELDFQLGGRDELFYPLLAGTLAAVPLMGAARFFGRIGAATVVALVYVLFRSSALLVVWAMGSYEHLTPPVFVLASALAIDLALWATGGRGVLPAALLAGPALVAGEWGLRALLGVGGWEPLRVLASLAIIALAVAAGALAGERLGSLLRRGRGGAP